MTLFRFRSDSALVLVPVSVMDGNGRPVLTLGPENFQITEDGRSQKVSYVWKQDAPLSIAIVADLSNSMSGKVGIVRQAVSQFLSLAGDDDEFCLIELRDKAELVRHFGVQPPAILNELQQAKAGGHTALLDGMYLALEQMKRSHDPRKALLVISDGGDNHSRFSAREVRELALESAAAIYAVGPVPADMWFPESIGMMEELTESTGGREYAVDNPKQIAEAVQKIGSELRSQYVVGYIPTSIEPDGKYHRLRVKVLPPAGQTKVSTYWRGGYYAPR